MTKNQASALQWITTILQKHNVAYQITGGLAAVAYGATRELIDIDIDIQNDGFDLISPDLEKFSTFGPDHYKDPTWDLILLTLNYNGQLIDITGTTQQKIWDKKNGRWKELKSNLSTAIVKNIFGINVPVIDINELILYKKIIARDVDLIDIAQIS